MKDDKEKIDSKVHKFLLRNMILNKKLVYCKFLLQFSSGLEANYKDRFLRRQFLPKILHKHISIFVK